MFKVASTIQISDVEKFKSGLAETINYKTSVL